MQRGRLEQKVALLRVVKIYSGFAITRLGYIANLQRKHTKPMIKELEEAGLIETFRKGKKSVHARTTLEGRKFLYDWDKLLERIRETDLTLRSS